MFSILASWFLSSSAQCPPSGKLVETAALLGLLGTTGGWIPCQRKEGTGVSTEAVCMVRERWPLVPLPIHSLTLFSHSLIRSLLTGFSGPQKQRDKQGQRWDLDTYSCL